MFFSHFSSDELKKTWDETKKTIKGEYKQVSSEELLKAEEELKNPNALRKAITAIPHTYKHTKEFIEKTTKDIKDKAEKIKLYLEAKKRNIEFYFHQCGSMFLRDGENIGKWNLNEQIKRAEEIQHELEKLHR